MKQFHFAYCQQGASVNGRGGWQVRAVSSGLDEATLKPYLRFIDYRKPEQASITDAPRRLALCAVELPNGKRERVLAHSVFVGTETGRMQDAFYSHAVLDLPAEFDGLDAIEKWGSGFWVEADGSGASQLPEVTEMPAGILTAESTSQFLSDPVQRGWAESCLQAILEALLAGKEQKTLNGQVFVVAPSAVVASIVHAVALCLPPSLRGRFTFSTYEGKPADVQDLLVGTVLSSSEQDLPRQFYASPHCALNTVTRRSNLPVAGVYSRQVISLLADAAVPATLRSFQEVIEKMTFSGMQDLNALARLLEAPPSSLSRDDIMEILDRPLLAQYCFTGVNGETLGARFLTEVYSAPGEFRAKALQRCRDLSVDKRSPSVAKVLRDAAKEQSVSDLREGKDGNVARAVFCIEKVLPDLGGSKTANEWKTVFCLLSGEANLSLLARVQLLVGADGADWTADEQEFFRNAAFRWCEVETKDMPLILKSPLRAEFHEHALVSCLQREWPLRRESREMPAEVRSFLEAPSSRELLTQLVLAASQKESGLFLNSLLDVAHVHGACAAVVISALSVETRLSQANVELVIDAVTNHGHTEVESSRLLCSLLTLKNFAEALSSCRETSPLARYVSSAVKNLDVDAMLSEECLDLLDKLNPYCRTKLDQDARRRYEAMVRVINLISEPVADSDQLRALNSWYSGLKINNQSDVGKRLFQALTLCATEQNLKTILFEMQGVQTDGQAAWFSKCAAAIAQRRDDVRVLGGVIYELVREARANAWDCPALGRYIEREPAVFSATCVRFVNAATGEAEWFIDRYMGQLNCNHKIESIMRVAPSLSSPIIDKLLLKADAGFDPQHLLRLTNVANSPDACRRIARFVMSLRSDCCELLELGEVLHELDKSRVPLDAGTRGRLGLLVAIVRFLEAEGGGGTETLRAVLQSMTRGEDQDRFVESLFALSGKLRYLKEICRCYLQDEVGAASLRMLRPVLLDVVKKLCKRLSPLERRQLEQELELVPRDFRADPRRGRWAALFSDPEGAAKKCQVERKRSPGAFLEVKILVLTGLVALGIVVVVVVWGVKFLMHGKESAGEQATNGPPQEVVGGLRPLEQGGDRPGVAKKDGTIPQTPR